MHQKKKQIVLMMIFLSKKKPLQVSVPVGASSSKERNIREKVRTINLTKPDYQQGDENATSKYWRKCY